METVQLLAHLLEHIAWHSSNICHHAFHFSFHGNWGPFSSLHTSVSVQVINVACWLAPNAYLVAVPCRWNGWNSEVINAFGVLRWTCWNTHFVIFLIQAHNLCAWTSPKGRPQ